MTFGEVKPASPPGTPSFGRLPRLSPAPPLGIRPAFTAPTDMRSLELARARS